MQAMKWIATVTSLVAASIAAAGPRDLDVAIELVGQVGLHPERTVHVHARMPGVVRAVLKGIGDSVRAGETLAQVEANAGIQTFALTSSISGTILNRTIGVGQSIDESVEAFTVTDVSTVLVTLVASARDLKQLKTGQKVRIESSDARISDEALLSYVSPILDERTRTAEVHVFLKNDAHRWRPGQFVAGHVTVGGEKAP